VNNNRRCKGRGERSHCKPNALLAMILREVLGKEQRCTGQACLGHAEYSRWPSQEDEPIAARRGLSNSVDLARVSFQSGFCDVVKVAIIQKII